METPTPTKSRLAILGHVLSVFGALPLIALFASEHRQPDLLCAGFGVTFIPSMPGLAVSGAAVARCRIHEGRLRGRGIALAGFTISTLLLASGVVMLVWALIAVGHRLFP